MFVPCNYAGRPLNAKRRICRHPGIGAGSSVSAACCAACPHADPVAADEMLVPICTPQERDGVCVHRGKVVDTIGVRLCCGEERVPVHACDLHRRCTDESTPGVKSCERCQDFANQRPAELRPLIGPANLVWFVYPRMATRDIWQAQQDRIRDALSRFNGKKLLAIATDDSTDQAAIERDGWDEVVELPNDPQQWELPGWRWAMERVKDQPGFTVRLHAKGTVRGVGEQYLARWWELGYAAMLDVDAVRKSLESNVVTGVFRRNTPAKNLGTSWHYTGSFYAFRNAEIFSADWQPESKSPLDHYVEAWPALVAPRELAGCMAYDGVGDLYQGKNWRPEPTLVAIKPAEQPLEISGEPAWEKDSFEWTSRTPATPAISIVIPAWNEAPRIEKCLRSLQQQTYGDFEAIIVDDGSTDGTEGVVRRIIAGDGRFSFLRKSHGGIGDTLNAGFDRCRAELLTWVSADSWVRPEFLARLKTALDANPDKVMAYSDWEHFDEATGKSITVREPEFDRKGLQSRCRIGVCWLFRASAKAKAGPYVNDPCEDYYMHLMLAQYGDFVKVPAVLGAWRNHPGNTSNRICNPTKWAANSVVKAKARWQQAKYRVAYLCPNLDAASVGWLHMNAVNDLSDDFAVRHVLGDVTHVTPGVDLRLCPPRDDSRLIDEARQILSECDVVHVNNAFPDCRPVIFEAIKDKPLVIHMHGGRWQWDSARLRQWKERGVPILTCTPGHSVGRWMANVMPIGSEHLTNAAYYTPTKRMNPRVRMICHHNYPAGKGVDQLTDVVDGLDEVVFSRTLKSRMEWSLATDKKLSLLDHLQLKQGFDLCLDTLTHGYCGMATWEAMAMGQAVICRMDEKTQAEYRGYFGSAPPVINPCRIDDLVDELAALARDPAAVKERGRINRAWIEKNYAAADILDRYETIYRDAIHGRV